MIVIILAFSSIATGFITFNSAIEKNQAENLTKSEVISTRVSNIENRLDKIESKIDSIRDHMMPISKP